MLNYARANKCPWDKEACAYAIKNIGLSIFKLSKRKKCPWDVWTSRVVAECGRLDILQWVIKNGCPWCKGTLTAAAIGEHLDVFQWALEHGCDWDCKRDDIESFSPNVIEWMKGHVALSSKIDTE